MEPKIFKFGGDGGAKEKRISSTEIVGKSVEFWGGAVLDSIRIIHGKGKVEILGGGGGRLLGSIIWPKDEIIDLVELKGGAFRDITGEYDVVSAIAIRDDEKIKTFGSSGCWSWDCDTGVKVKLREVSYGKFVDSLKFEMAH